MSLVLSLLSAFAGFVQADDTPALSAPEYPGAALHVLDADEGDRRRAARLELPAHFSSPASAADALAREYFVLQGSLRMGELRLEANDYVFVPAGVSRPALTSEQGARVLEFRDPGPGDAAIAADLARVGLYITRASGAQWTPGTVSQAAGVDIQLRIRQLRKDPWSGARTWLVATDPGQVIPFEQHRVIEEGYLVEGRYRLVECLQGGLRSGVYEPGGYFRRPAGIVHSGPESGPLETSIWLLRTPAPLDVRFSSSCDGAG